MLSINKESFKRDYKKKFLELHGIELEEGKNFHKYEALGCLVRDYIAEDWVNTKKKYESSKQKQVYYFSMEFLLGRLLGDALLNLGIRETCREALKELNIDLEELEEFESDQGLGNGGLGRLAACFLDSMASLNIAGHGCGIRYKYGFFNQKIIDGSQVETPDSWLKNGNVWEVKKPDKSEVVKFGGNIKCENINGRLTFTHVNYEPILAVPYDTPIVGYENNVVNNLRLWSAEPVDNEFDFCYFNRGKYLKAIEYRNSIEAISQVLYPDDSNYAGELLRLKQEYFFVSAGIQDIIRKYKKNKLNINNLFDKVAIHINDTHPTLCIPELMRILLDEENLSWDEAWEITKKTVSYTNHTIMSEAMEKWPVSMMKELLPRIYMIIEEINRRYVEELNNKGYDQDRIKRMSIIDCDNINMANLCIVTSHSVNGVAKLHTHILETEVLKDFYQDEPNKFNNKTNGIAHRRWLISSNPQLSNLITDLIGDSWKKDTLQLKNIEKFKNDSSVLQRLDDIKYNNKANLAKFIKDKYDLNVDPSSIFDVQVKRLHAYKRQLLNIFNVLHMYHELLDNPNLNLDPRTFIFGAKAAPGYYLAKCIIKFINSVASTINNDVRVKDKLKVVFLENYGVSLAEIIIPAANVSEQISTTTKEASGTSNMKFMMNGAITLATLDGANVEICEQVGKENMFLFGLSAEQVLNYNKYGGYSSLDLYHSNMDIKRVVDDLINGFIPNLGEEGRSIYNSLTTYNDEYFVLRDFENYGQAQADINRLYRDKEKWNKMSLVNIANSGFFSSDRTISEYAKDIWFKRV